MKIHREGYTTLTVLACVLIIINGGIFFYFDGSEFAKGVLAAFSVVFFLLILQFFRYPGRDLSFNEKYVMSPADGKVVVIEQTEEKEYFKDKRIQISIFMSPINVHANWYPVSGRIKYLRYHFGKYFLAWHPKASTHNERTTIVIERENKVAILVRQIAGALAKRIVYYPHEGDMVRQGAELGFIKFGSRLDVFIPVDSVINVKLNERVKGGITILAELAR